ncbi:MAG: queuosine salvage family protein [Solirubrobacteraceae bacterium MAG38_C4-C5]|nr:queuosine salvage family protein [Candidatus Siliceabacter maunaloa]
MGPCEEVREHCARVAAGAQSVRIDLDALGGLEPPMAPEPSRGCSGGSLAISPPALDPQRHYLEGTPADVATYLLTLDAINFGSGWFPTLRKRRGCSGYFTIAWALADRFRAEGPWTNVQLRAMHADELADVLGQARDQELIALYAQALRTLGAFLGERSALDLVHQAGGSAQRLAEELAGGMAMFADRGFYKRAQIVPADLALAGVATFADLDDLTIFADNLVPHVLRGDGVLVYEDRLAAHVDARRPLRPGAQEQEIRACAVHACELLAQRVGVAPRTLDHWLWNRGQAPEIKARPRHRCRCVYY